MTEEKMGFRSTPSTRKSDKLAQPRKSATATSTKRSTTSANNTSDPVAKRQKCLQNGDSADDLADDLNSSDTTIRKRPSPEVLIRKHNDSPMCGFKKQHSTHGSSAISRSNTFFNEVSLKEYVQKSANAANEKWAERVEKLTARLERKTQNEVVLSNQLKIQRDETDNLRTAVATLRESHNALAISSNKAVSAPQSARREDEGMLSYLRQKEQEMMKLCQGLKSAKQTYVDAKENIPRRIREVLDEELGPALADLKVLQESEKAIKGDSKAMQDDIKRLVNRVELLTSATTGIKTEVGVVVRRVDDTVSATTRDMKLLQTNLKILQEGDAQLKADLSGLDDKVKRVDTRVDRDHNTFIHDIKDAKDRYASLSTQVEHIATLMPELKASMETYTDGQFARAVAHTDDTAQKHLPACEKHTEATSKSLADLQRAYIELQAVSEAFP
jgi:hypothetical protein